MKKKISAILVALVVLMMAISIVSAEEQAFTDAKKIIEDKVPCDDLSQDQLEHLGDYYMEQMHPGEAHELMDEKMGGEGSESLKQMHISMGQRFYCGTAGNYSGMMGSGMMEYGVMGGMGMMNSGMMSSGNTGCGMMNNGVMGAKQLSYQNKGGMMNRMGYGMMGGSGFFTASLLSIIYIAIAAFVFGIIFWWTYKLVVNDKEKKKK